MRLLIPLFLSIVLFCQTAHSQKVIFLHHSTGGNVYEQGNVAQLVTDYNNSHGTNYSVSESAYPNDPYPWENYPYDYWNLWVNKNCDSEQSGIECLSSLTQKYDVIIFKHCFPGASISEDLGTPDVASDRKSLENYKLQYRALRQLMDSYPTTKFMVWTLAPLHRNATSVEEAARARQFVDWVKGTWLTEDGKSHPNIYIFDFYGIVAELNANPEKGAVNCLKYDYEGDHDGSDSHPNYEANQVAGPLFTQAIVNCIEDKPLIVKESSQPGYRVAYDPTSKSYTIMCDKPGTVAKAILYKVNGEKVNEQSFTSSLSLPFTSKGVYLLKIADEMGIVTYKLRY